MSSNTSTATGTNRTAFVLRTTSTNELQLMIPATPTEAGRLMKCERLYLMDEFPGGNTPKGSVIGYSLKFGCIVIRSLSRVDMRQQLLRFLPLGRVNAIMMAFVSSKTTMVNFPVSIAQFEHVTTTIEGAITHREVVLKLVREEHLDALHTQNPRPGRRSVVPVKGFLSMFGVRLQPRTATA